MAELENIPPRSRYPGSRPFERADKDLFFGRNQDIIDLCKFVNVNNLSVLYGKSGYGKSSLINAGVIPKFEDEGGYKSLFFRFTAFQKAKPQTLKAIFAEKMVQYTEGYTFMPELASGEPSLWQHFKALQWTFKNNKGLLLVLDQFEEIFSYDGDLEVFAREFSEIMANRMPESFQNKLYDHIENDPDFLEKHKAELEFLENNPNFRIIIGIRSDKMSLLDRLSFYIPDILKNMYELKALNHAQAFEAIDLPAHRIGNYISPRFEFEETTIPTIIDYLTQKGTKNVESFQLQIICKHLEDCVIKKYQAQPYFSKDTVNTEPFTEGGALLKISPTELGDLSLVIRDYYRNIVTNVATFTPIEQMLVRFFVEKRLIDEKTKSRVSLDKIFVGQIGVTEDILTKLVDTRLVRREPNTVSGASYELSHDTLVEPVLNVVALIGKLEDNVQTFFKQAIDSFPEKERLDWQIYLQNNFLTDSGGVQQQIDSKLAEADKAKIQVLLDKNLLRTNVTLDNDRTYDLHSFFFNILRDQKRAREEKEKVQVKEELKEQKEVTEQARSGRRQAFTLASLAFLGLVVSVYSSILAYKNSEQAIRALDDLKVAQNEKRAVEAALYLQNAKVYGAAKEYGLAEDELDNSKSLIDEGLKSIKSDSLMTEFKTLQGQVDSFKTIIQKSKNK